MQLPPEQEKRLQDLCAFFLEENSKVNLSAFRTPEACWNGNVLDSISFIEALPKLLPSPLPLSQWERGVPSLSRDEERETKQKTNSKVLHNAREMRKVPTEAEEKLWETLRRNQLDVHFRRQHPLDGMILDFYCHEAKLCIEVDGEIHNSLEEREWDEQRQSEIEARGISVLRFTNQEVLQDMDAVVMKIAKNIDELRQPCLRILDVGTGGGFPLLPLAILMPNARFMGLDATQKKIDAIQRIVDQLGLSNVQLVCGRTEELGHDPDFREQFDIVTARAVAELNTLLEFTVPFVKVKGHVVEWKSMNIEKELQDSLLARAEFSCHLMEKFRYILPGDWGERQLLLFKKTFALKPEFPRAVGIPKKHPIL